MMKEITHQNQSPFLTVFLLSLAIMLGNGCASQKHISVAPQDSRNIIPHSFPYSETDLPNVSFPPLPLQSFDQNSGQFKYFLKIALGSEYGLGDFTIKKWKTDICIEVSGQPTPEDLQTLCRVIDDLNDIIGDKIHIDIVASGGNVQIHFIPQAEFYQYEPPGIVFYGGFFWNWWNYSGEISQSRIVIASDRLTQRHRSHLIREELTQALGLMNDAMDFKDSIFYQGYSEITEFSPLDRDIIKLLYDEQITAGMSNFQVKEVFSNAERTY
jgi:hypothetical protein